MASRSRQRPPGQVQPDRIGRELCTQVFAFGDDEKWHWADEGIDANTAGEGATPDVAYAWGNDLPGSTSSAPVVRTVEFVVLDEVDQVGQFAHSSRGQT
jgi:hypothetical protein